MNSGAHGKFLSRLDLDVAGGRVAGAIATSSCPCSSRHVAGGPRDGAADRRDPRAVGGAARRAARGVGDRSSTGAATSTAASTSLLDALLKRSDAEVAFSPGFRWGITVVPGQAITLEDVYAHTGLTYPNTLVRELTGAEIHRVMEDVADNLFHPDPYYRQGGDMVRVGGLSYTIDPRPARWAGGSRDDPGRRHAAGADRSATRRRAGRARGPRRRGRPPSRSSPRICGASGVSDRSATPRPRGGLASYVGTCRPSGGRIVSVQRFCLLGG